jgi:hypothetical protein
MALRDKIIAFYSFDDGTSLVTRRNDSSPNANHLSVSTAPTYVSSGGKPNSYVFHTSAVNTLFMTDTTKFTFGNGTTDFDFGGAAFFTPNSISSAVAIMCKRGNSSVSTQTNNEWSFDVNSTTIRLRVFDNNNNTQNGNTNFIQFQTVNFFENNTDILHVAFDYQASTKTCRIWKNGVLQTVGKTTTGTYIVMWNSPSNFSVVSQAGFGSGSKFFDSCAISSALWTQEDINTLYNGGKGLNPFSSSGGILTFGTGQGM